MAVDPHIAQIAQRTLTQRQWLILHYQLTGMSQRAIAYRLDISRTTVTDTLDAAYRQLRRHGIHVTPDGHPYLEEQKPA